MSQTNYVGAPDLSSLLGEGNIRYFYALRRDDEGFVYLTKVDQVLGDDVVQVNKAGDAADDFDNFEFGIDFFDGILDDKSRPFANLTFDQYKWDERNIYYYINDEGELVARINKKYEYPADQIV
jgi:hypothetical protein